MRAGLMLIGMVILVLGVILLSNSSQVLFLLDNKPHTLLIATDVDNDSSVNIAFDFDKTYISKIYDISEGQKVYKNYINVFTSDFLDNTSTSAIDSMQINSNAYIPVNRTYEYALQIEDETLNPISQSFGLNKTPGLIINRIELSYIGADYNLHNTYDSFVQVISVIVILFGFAMMVYYAGHD